MKKKLTFNMIEILLALGVIAIGVSSIMVLFPVGASAFRDASMETYTANMAEQLLNNLKYEISSDANKWQGYILGKETTPSFKEFELPTASNSGSLTFAEEQNPLNWKAFSGVLGGNIECAEQTLKTKELSKLTGIFRVSSKRVGQSEADFRAIFYTWQSPISFGGVSSDFAVQLNVEATWPAERPHASRQKSLYTREIFNPNVLLTPPSP